MIIKYVACDGVTINEEEIDHIDCYQHVHYKLDHHEMLLSCTRSKDNRWYSGCPKFEIWARRVHEIKK